MNHYLLMSIFFIVLLSGCVQTGEVVKVVNTINETNFTVSDEPETSTNGKNQSNYTESSEETLPGTETDANSGEAAVPGVQQPESPALCETLTCGICEFPNFDICKCSTVLFCDGNGICEYDEYPGSTDCPNCDDGDHCTEDYYDYSAESCAHETLPTCCGNTYCEGGEDDITCPIDCEEEQSGDVAILYVNYDAPGDDRKKENWNGEWIEVEGYNVDITGWVLSDEANHTYTFPVFMISGRVRVHSGDGEDNETDLYWNGGRRPIWNNDGDTATLTDDFGEVVDEYSY